MHSLIRLKHIVAVARSASFSIAAEEVGISQPALSRSIQVFEEEYGVRLFDRGKGGVTLTPAGTLAVEQARGLLAAASDFDRHMRRFGFGEAGRTGVGMGPLMASLLLPGLATSLLQRSSQVTFVTRVGPPDLMLEALLEGAIELIVGNAWQLSLLPGVTEERLGVLELGVAVRAEHPLAATEKLTMRDLDAFPSARAFAHRVTSPESDSGAFICENFSIMRDVVAETDCTWLIAPAFIKAELEQERFVMLKVQDLPSARMDISLAYLRNRTRSPVSLLVAEQIRAMVAKIGVA